MERISNWTRDSIKMLELQGKSRLLFTKPPDSYIGHNEGISPIVLIPGLRERWGVLKKIADSVSRRGYDVFTVPELEENLFDIRKSADMVESVIEEKGLNHVRLIIHSKGVL